MSLQYQLVVVLFCISPAPCSGAFEEKVGVLEASSRAALAQAHEFLSRGKLDVNEVKPASSNQQQPSVEALARNFLSDGRHDLDQAQPASSDSSHTHTQPQTQAQTQTQIEPVPVTEPFAERETPGNEKDKPIHPPFGSFGPEHFLHCAATVWAGTQGRAVVGEVPAGQDRELRAQKDGFCLFAIFDGHGKNGHVISQAAKERVEEQFRANKMSNVADMQSSLDAVSQSIQDIPEAHDSGSTGAGVITSPSGDFLVFHLGDSRVLWAKDDGSVLGHSVDHDCDNSEEVAQLHLPCFEHRMTCDRDSAGVALSSEYVRMSMVLRSFGDKICHHSRKDGQFSKAVVESVPRKDVKWLLLGSDGVFGPVRQYKADKLQLGFSNELALQYLMEGDDMSRRPKITNMLDSGSRSGIHELTIKGKTVEYVGTGDDQSIIAVRLGDVQA